MDDFKPIASSARLVWAGSALTLLAVLALFAAVPLAVAESVLGLAALGVLVLALAAWSVLWAHRRWKAWGYAERDVELHIRRGVLIRRLTIVPYGRMQSVDVRQGPLDRALGVSTIHLNTAAAGSDARIPFLIDSEAQRLRDRLTELGEVHAAGL